MNFWSSKSKASALLRGNQMFILRSIKSWKRDFVELLYKFVPENLGHTYVHLYYATYVRLCESTRAPARACEIAQHCTFILQQNCKVRIMFYAVRYRYRFSLMQIMFRYTADNSRWVLSSKGLRKSRVGVSQFLCLIDLFCVYPLIKFAVL